MKFSKIFKGFSKKYLGKKEDRLIAIDLGTSNTIIHIKDKGIVIDEPTYISRNKKTEKIEKIGSLAKEIFGKEPKYIEIIRPLKNGVISNYEATLNMIQYYLDSIKDDKITNDKVIVCVPSGVTQVERRSVFNVMLDAGARDVHLIEEPLVAAIGAKIDIFAPKAHLIVNIGAGTTEISFISSGGDSFSKSIRIAGDHLDDDIVEHIRDKYGILIGTKTAEKLKIDANSTEKIDNKVFEIRGTDTVTQLPKSIKIDIDIVDEAIKSKINILVDSIKLSLEEIVPEIAADIYETGIYLSGGGANIRILKQRIEEEFKLEVKLVENPVYTVINGIAKVLEDLDKYSNLIVSDHTEY